MFSSRRTVAKEVSLSLICRELWLTNNKIEDVACQAYCYLALHGSLTGLANTALLLRLVVLTWLPPWKNMVC